MSGQGGPVVRFPDAGDWLYPASEGVNVAGLRAVVAFCFFFPERWGQAVPFAESPAATIGYRFAAMTCWLAGFDVVTFSDPAVRPPGAEVFDTAAALLGFTPDQRDRAFRTDPGQCATLVEFCDVLTAVTGVPFDLRRIP